MVSRAAWLVSFAFLVAMLGTTLPTPLYPIYERTFGFNSLTITLIFAIYAFGVIASLVLFGKLSDAIGRKPVLFGGLVLTLMSAAALFFANALAPVIAARVFSGLAAGLFTGTASAYLIDLAPPSQRARGAALAVAANIGGLGIGTLLSGLLAQYAPFPLRLVYAVDFAATLLAIVALAFATETVVTTTKFTLQAPKFAVPQNIRHVFLQAAIGGVCSFAVAGLLSSIAPSLLSQVLHIANHAVAGLPVFAMMSTSAIGQLLVGRMNRTTALRAATSLLLVGIILLSGAIAFHSWQLLFAASIIEGLGQGIGVGSGLAEINARITAERAEVSSTYFVFLYLGLALPVIALGLLVDVTGLVTASLAFCALIGLTLAVVFAAQLRTSTAIPTA